MRQKLGSPVIFHQDRPGKDEKIFRLYKFRSMTDARGADGELLPDATSCAMCRRLIINAGIAQVVCRTGADEYTTTLVRDWVYHDDSIG